MVGTGKYTSSKVMLESLSNSDCEIITVAVRRVQTDEDGENLKVRRPLPSGERVEAKHEQRANQQTSNERRAKSHERQATIAERRVTTGGSLLGCSVARLLGCSVVLTGSIWDQNPKMHL